MPDITYGRWSPTEVMERVLDGTWVAATEDLGGMVLLTPTSIAYSGTSASIGANGSVTFTAVTSLSLNGVFSATYDNYMIVCRHLSSVAYPTITFRYRTSGTDASGSNYVSQYITGDSTTVGAARTATSTSGNMAYSSNVQRSGSIAYVYGPFLSQPTASRSVTGAGDGNAWLIDTAVTHSLSTSYDGFSFIMSSGTLAGLLGVYGMRK